MAADGKGKPVNEWSIAVAVGPDRTSGRLTDDDISTLAEMLAEHAPVISAGDTGLTLRLAWKAHDASAAVAGAVPAILGGLQRAGWRDPVVRKLEVTDWTVFERELQEPTYPEVAGISEIAELLGTSRQRASELARSSRFPAPHAELAAGPVWLKPSVMRFIQEWDRRPGRPRSKTATHVAERVTRPLSDEATRA